MNGSQPRNSALSGRHIVLILVGVGITGAAVLILAVSPLVRIPDAVLSGAWLIGIVSTMTVGVVTRRRSRRSGSAFFAALGTTLRDVVRAIVYIC